MISFGLERAAEIAGGRLHRSPTAGDCKAFVGMTQNSRELKSGNLYCALIGERVDGHRFVSDTAEAGAAAALVSRSVDAPIAQIVVDDVVQAMGRLARAWRESVDVRVVAVTGSNGKTTVKTMLAAILRGCAATLATRGNYNNEIGVPLTLAALDKSHRFAVIEMGCGKPGDIEYLARMARPDVAVVTNAGPAHLERLGSMDGVASTKGELFTALDDNGVAVINGDDDYHDYWRRLCAQRRKLTFGYKPESDIRFDAGGRVVTPAGSFELVLALPGEHNRMNALAATAAALALDLDLDAIAAGLASVEVLPGRLAEREMTGGWRLIDDTYNANPASLYAGLQVLAAHSGKRWLALGEMAELGDHSAKLHREIGRAAHDLGIERLFAIGMHADRVADAFGAGGEAFEDLTAMADCMQALLAPDVTCLVKGSRSAHMEQLVDRLRAVEATPC